MIVAIAYVVSVAIAMLEYMHVTQYVVEMHPLLSEFGLTKELLQKCVHPFNGGI